MTRSLLLVVVLLSCLRSAIGADPSPTTLDSIVKTLQTREKALKSFEIQGRQFVGDEAGERVPSTYSNEYAYTHTNEGQSEYHDIMTSPDGVRSVSEWIRDDGKKLYSMRCAPKSDNVIEYVVIQETPNQPSRRVAPMFPYLNVLTPRGRQLSTLVATGKSMNIVQDAYGEAIVELKVTDSGREFDLRLSVAHDFLPREVIFSERVRNVATSFRNIDGFWFPDSGYSKEVNSKGGDLRLDYRIDRISVNPAKSPKDFDLPKLNVGTVIHNQTKSGPRGVYGVPANDEIKARKAVEQLRNEYGSNSENEKDSKSSRSLPIDASSDPEESGIPRSLLVLGAAFALIVAGFLYRRQ